MTLQLLDHLVLLLDMLAFLIDLLADVVEQNSFRLAHAAAQAVNVALELVDAHRAPEIDQALGALVFQKR